MAYDTFEGAAGTVLANTAWNDGGIVYSNNTAWRLRGDGTITNGHVAAGNFPGANFALPAGFKGLAVFFRSSVVTAGFAITLDGSGAVDNIYGPPKGIRAHIGDYSNLYMYDWETSASAEASCPIPINTDLCFLFTRTDDPSNRQYKATLYRVVNGALGTIVGTLTMMKASVAAAADRRVFMVWGTDGDANLAISRMETVPLTIDPAPTGQVTNQPAPNGQNQRFVLSTSYASTATISLARASGGNLGPFTFPVSNNTSDFTLTELDPDTYTPTITVSGTGGVANVTGAQPFTIAGVDGSSEIPVGGVVLAGADFNFGYGVLPALTGADFNFGYTLQSSFVSTDFNFAYAIENMSMVSKDFNFEYAVQPALVSASFGFSYTVESLSDEISANYVPSAARTLRALAASGHFEGGVFWDLTDPTRPVGRKDPDSKIDISIDWEDVLNDIQDELDGITYKMDGFTYAGGRNVGTLTSVLLAAGAGPVSAVTFVMTTKSTPPRVEERTVYLKMGDQ